MPYGHADGPAAAAGGVAGPGINGVSTSEVNVSYQKVTATNYAILIHKSPEEIGDVVARATIGQPMAMLGTGGGGESPTAGRPILAALLPAIGLTVLTGQRRRRPLMADVGTCG